MYLFNVYVLVSQFRQRDVLKEIYLLKHTLHVDRTTIKTTFLKDDITWSEMGKQNITKKIY